MTVSISKPILAAFILAAFTLNLSFHTSIPVHAVSFDTTDIIQPKIKDVLGRDISQAAAGSPATVEVGIENNENIVHPFVLLVEVRDSSDRTTFLAWQSGSLSPMESSEVGVSWTPENKGDYEVRAFAISNLQNPEILSEVQSREIEVGDFIEFMPPVADAELQEEPVEQASTLTALRQHALDRINEDRKQYGLPPVSLSDNSAAQAHAEDVFETKQISHWTTDGEKPYMTYSRHDGIGDVAQNIATTGDLAGYLSCVSGAFLCGRIDPFEEIKDHEYAMMYDDDECCDNGHRDNILDKYHTHVSIGVAYDAYFLVLVQNFENQYIAWADRINEDNPSDDTITMAGYFENNRDGYTSNDLILDALSIYYDESPTRETYKDNIDTQSYGSGELVGVVVEPLRSGWFYEQPGNYTLIEAGEWQVSNKGFEIEFSLQELTIKHGDGVYTVTVWSKDENDDDFVASSISLFIT